MWQWWGRRLFWKHLRCWKTCPQWEKEIAKLALRLTAYAYVAIFRKGSTLGTELLEKWVTGGIEHIGNDFYLACLFELGQTMLWECCKPQTLLPVRSESGDELEEVNQCLLDPGFAGRTRAGMKMTLWTWKSLEGLDGARCRLAVLCVVLWGAPAFSTSCKHSCV